MNASENEAFESKNERNEKKTQNRTELKHTVKKYMNVRVFCSRASFTYRIDACVLIHVRCP